MSHAVKIGIVGFGRIGLAHARCAEHLKDCFDVTAVADNLPERRKEAQDLFGCHAYADGASLVKDSAVEAVVVATPSHLHKQNTVEALRAGKHVMCDKPAARSLAEVDAMIHAAKESGKLLTFYQQERFTTVFRKVQEVIQSGRLGRIVQIRRAVNTFERRWDWQTLKAYGGGRLFNAGAHLLDQALHLMRDPEPEVFAHLDLTMALGDADDHVKVILRGEGDPLMDVEISSTCAYPGDAWLVMGTLGTLRGSKRELFWKYITPEQFPPQKVDSGAPADRAFAAYYDNPDTLPWQEEYWKCHKSMHPMPMLYRALYASIREGAPPAVSMESARRVMVVLEKCHVQMGNRYRDA